MKVSMPLSYAGGFKESARQAVALEKAGLDTVWVAEAYGFDGVSMMGYLAAVTETVQIGAAILPIYTRTPTLLGMTAAGVDALSDGRCILGLGASGPQVIEGFHGVPYNAPLGRTREIVDICRQVWRREKVEHQGKHYQIPLPAERGTGLGKPLKIINKPVRERIPIIIASLGPKNVEMTAEIAEGWQPLFYYPEKAAEVWGESIAKGKAKRDPELGDLQIYAQTPLAIGDDVDHMLDWVRPMVALYVGGMGAKGKNFYNDLAIRYGYAKEAETIQELYLAGKKEEAAAAVPVELLRSISLIGSEGFVRERVAAFAEAGVTTLNVTPFAADTAGRVRLIEQLRQICG